MKTQFAGLPASRSVRSVRNLHVSRAYSISFPKRLRYFLQRNPAVRSAALRAVLRIIEQALKEQSPGAGPTAQIGAVAFIHHFGAALNEHTHFHICVIDGVFEGAQNDSPIAFFEATAMDAATVAAMQLTPLEFIGRLTALIPAPRLHRHRYYGAC